MLLAQHLGEGLQDALWRLAGPQLGAGGQHGLRGLPGGSSLARLLREQVA
jgi:hypothetical protein